MATISLRVLRDDNSQLLATRTVADADVTRVITALSAILGKTPPELMLFALDRICDRAIAMTKQREQGAVPVAPIPVA